ncbi:MAG: trimethylamine methyltransferase family protein [Dehalococcoidia bacterium]|nr:MAG: trimethylamine methyltransferase family protein [Dehalococcoidia bacterium]
MSENIRMDLLSTEEVNNIYEKCFLILSEKGVKVDHEEGLKFLSAHGAHVDNTSHVVKFPRDIVEKALASVPHEATLTGGIVIPDNSGKLYANTETGANNYIDPETNIRHSMTIEFDRLWAQLVEQLDEISICAYQSPTDVPTKTADIHGLKTLLENTSKHIMVHPYSLNSLNYLFELGLVVAGSKEEYKKKPRFNFICCSQAPLVFKEMDYEAIKLSCEYGQIVLPASLTTAGATCPVTIAGQITQVGVEILAMIVFSQLIEKGTPVIGNPFSFALNMSTGRNLLGSVEAVLSEAACCEFIKKAFNIPVGQNGFGSDSHITDGQSTFEEAFMGLFGAFTIPDFLIGAGALSTILCVSPTKLIIDAKGLNILNRARAGIKVSEETIALDEIINIQQGGHYLENKHTLKHCREAIRVPLFNTDTYDTWVADGSKDMHTRATETYMELKKNCKPLDLDEHIKKELNNIVKSADKNLSE